MNFDLSDEQKMLAEQTRGLLAERSTHDRLRGLIEQGAEWDEALWGALVELGYPGLAIPERYGGLGLSALDLGVVSEALGGACAAVPFFSSSVLAADAILLAGSEAQRERWLPRLASGALIATFAYAEDGGGWPNGAGSVTLAEGRLSGVKMPVADAGIASLAVVLAQDADGPVLAVAELEAAGVRREKLASFDQLRAHHALYLDGAAAERLEGSSAAVIEALFDRAAVQAAFEAVGGASACLVMARDYVMDRQIFGRSLASYQAVKHKLADLAVAIELARSNAYYGAWAVDGAPGELAGAAAGARLTAGSAYEMGARENLQLHGGIGYTFEANCHFYYRRERLLAIALGPRSFWADRLLASLPDAGRTP